MADRVRRCPYPYQHTPHEHVSVWGPAQCDGRPEAPAEPDGLPAGLLLKLTHAISRVLGDHPEHNRTDEHDHVVHEVTQAVLTALYELPPDRTDPEDTTAARLLAYRRELQHGRMHPDIVDELTKAAAGHLLAHDGLHVRPGQTPPTGVPSKPLPPEQT
ncbi:hypothetical protein [Streptomyces sp. JV180]|uniref:hypothetical protein n=1 Tax=Streptomyces sp. JV180 TaxID=858634 RepID=UPI00168B2AAF|nr:hypothetical protein [Streptomyces sp. JV180]MBD3546824.1 hypothetical protein [Streptomyces sp. JV180]